MSHKNRFELCRECGHHHHAGIEDGDLQCERCERRTLSSRLGVRGGLIAASLFGLSAIAPIPASAQPPEGNVIQPMYGVVPEPAPQPEIELKVNASITGINELDNGLLELEIELPDLEVEGAAPGPGSIVYLNALGLQTQLSRCDGNICVATLDADVEDLEDHREVLVTVLPESTYEPDPTQDDDSD